MRGRQFLAGKIECRSNTSNSWFLHIIVRKWPYDKSLNELWEFLWLTMFWTYENLWISLHSCYVSKSKIAVPCVHLWWQTITKKYNKDSYLHCVLSVSIVIFQLYSRKFPCMEYGEAIVHCLLLCFICLHRLLRYEIKKNQYDTNVLTSLHIVKCNYNTFNCKREIWGVTQNCTKISNS